MDLKKLSPSERLAAEQAVLMYRELHQAVMNAPHGHGLATLETAVLDKGFDYLRNMMTLAANARPEAQKKGSASKPVSVADAASSKA